MSQRPIPVLRLLILPIVLLVSPLEATAQPATERLVQDNSAFAFDLYYRLAATEGNVFFSPYSISTAPAMTYAGARGNTEKEMAATLHFSLSQKELHPAFARMEERLKKLQQDGSVRLAVANSLWPQEGHPFLDGDLSLLRNQTGSIPFLGRLADSSREG